MMKKSYFCTYGSNCSTEEIAHLLNKSLDLEFVAHESSYLGEYYKYSGMYADKITIQVKRDEPGDRDYDKHRPYRTLIFISNVDGKNADKLSKTKSAKDHFKQISQIAFIEETMFEEKGERSFLLDMDNLDNDDVLYEANQLLEQLLKENAGNLDSESQEAVAHYLHHDEYEMAFEGIFIDLMEAGKISSTRNLDEYKQLGKKLNLDKESVFDGNFWGKFVRFVDDLHSKS